MASHGGSMEIDVVGIVGAVDREVGEGERDGVPTRVIRATRDYNAPVAEVWDAMTDPERIPRWFLPVSGDLVPGGRYQFEGNAGGEILACDAPTRLSVTWEFGGDVTWVEVTLSPIDAEATRLVLEHTARPSPEMWSEYGPGGVGVGWDMALMGLGLHLETGGDVSSEAAAGLLASPQGRQLVQLTSQDWGRASIAAGTDRGSAESAAARTTAFYLGEEGAGEG